MGLMRISKLWPQRTIPFTISSNVPAQFRTAIQSAVQVWNDNTVIKLTPLAELLANPNWMSKHPNPAVSRVHFVLSVYGGRCNSHVGRKGGTQLIRCLSTWSVGPLVHEIGHAIGLYHEQQRMDRDNFVIVVPAAIPNYKAVDYVKKSPPWAMPHGSYNCRSVMHYSQNNGFLRKTKGGCTAIGPATGATLTKGDIDAVDFWYKKKVLF
jgi:Astacin (Peptidase family M12A)